MKKLILSFFIMATINSVHAQNFSNTINTIAQNNDLAGGQVVVWCNNAIIENVAFGKANIANNTPYQDSTLARIASISKTITAIAFMQCVEQNLCTLDQDASTILGFTLRNPNFLNTVITPRMLLSHTSSIVDGTGYGNFLTATSTAAVVPNISELLSPISSSFYTSDMFNTITPGTYFNYANINFGILGTMVEKLTNKRFDIYVKENILQPLQISGGYLVQDLNLNNLAVLYRKPSGVWTPQVDNYNGVAPALGNISSYVVGTNAIRFSPTGGLRISAQDLAKIFMLLANKGSLNNLTILQAASVSKMTNNEWTYNGSNGNSYYGLFRSWGLGLQRSTNTVNQDVVLEGNPHPMVGHAGEAYGLVSDAYFDTASHIGFALIITGAGAGYTTSASSAFYTVEKEIFDAIHNRVNNNCAPTGNTNTPILKNNIKYTRANNALMVELLGNDSNKKYAVKLYNAVGQQVFAKENCMGITKVECDDYNNDLYILEIKVGAETVIKKISL